MPRYIVTIRKVTSYNDVILEVEAEDEDEAEDHAFAEAELNEDTLFNGDSELHVHRVEKVK